MDTEQIRLAMAVGGGAVALALLLACAMLWRATRRLAARVEVLEAARIAPRTTEEPVVVEPASYVITGVQDSETATGTEHDGVVTGRIDGALFADIVARESVIKAAGFAHGLRRALSPEARNRVRFEMKREVKRSRKQRRADLKAALRDVQARERAAAAREDAA